MKKLCIVLSLMFAIALILPGCGGGDDTLPYIGPIDGDDGGNGGDGGGVTPIPPDNGGTPTPPPPPVDGDPDGDLQPPSPPIF